MTETRAPFNGKKKEPAGVFVRLPLSEDAASIIRDDIASQILTTDALTHTILAIGTPVTGGERDYEATVAHYEAKLAERDAEIAKLHEYYKANEEINRVGLFGATPEMFAREKKARAALKGPEA